jgi:hypothetical protein
MAAGKKLKPNPKPYSGFGRGSDRTLPGSSFNSVSNPISVRTQPRFTPTNRDPTTIQPNLWGTIREDPPTQNSSGTPGDPDTIECSDAQSHTESSGKPNPGFYHTLPGLQPRIQSKTYLQSNPTQKVVSEPCRLLKRNPS